MKIYTFWLTLTICFFLFLWMLKKLSYRYHYSTDIFWKNLFWFFISTFIFSRLFYVISKWNELKYIRNPLDFFLMNDYNFSLFWALFGFFLVLYVNIKLRKEKLEEYIDGVSIAFLFILWIWYIGAFLGGQVYGRETSFWIEVMYNHPFTSVPFQIPIFPLAIIYSSLFFIVFSSVYISSLFLRIKWLLWYISIAIFATFIFIFEFFSGKYDILKDHTPMNLPQLFSIILLGFIGFQIYNLYFKNNSSNS